MIRFIIFTIYITDTVNISIKLNIFSVIIGSNLKYGISR